MRWEEACKMPSMWLELRGARPIRRCHHARRSTGTVATDADAHAGTAVAEGILHVDSASRGIAKASETGARAPALRICARRSSAAGSCARPLAQSGKRAPHLAAWLRHRDDDRPQRRGRNTLALGHGHASWVQGPQSSAIVLTFRRVPGGARRFGNDQGLHAAEAQAAPGSAARMSRTTGVIVSHARRRRLPRSSHFSIVALFT
jgi:hypothetical protein